MKVKDFFMNKWVKLVTVFVAIISATVLVLNSVVLSLISLTSVTNIVAICILAIALIFYLAIFVTKKIDEKQKQPK